MRLAVEVVVVVSWALAGASVSAQTIADYSRSQRAVIEAEIARNTAKAMASTPVAAPVVAAPAPAAADKPSPFPPATPNPATPGDMPPWTVSGVFLSPSRSVAEVVVDGGAHLLAAGQAVPGTPWRVQSVAADKVVLVHARPGRSGKARPGAAAKVLRLPVGAP
jgi:type IV pilus biogenesis protein PilP